MTKTQSEDAPQNPLAKAARAVRDLFVKALAAALLALIGAGFTVVEPVIAVAAASIVNGEFPPLFKRDIYTMIQANDDEGGGPPYLERMELTRNSGEIIATGHDGGKAWRYHGYLHEQHVVLSYRSWSRDDNGFGVVFLQQTAANRDMLIGRIEGNSCPAPGRLPPRIVRCNALMVRGEANSAPVQAALRDFKDFLGPNGCAVDSIPLAPVATEPCPPPKP
jgi:hypothetical protein